MESTGRTARATVFPPRMRYSAPVGEVPASTAPPGTNFNAKTWGSATRATSRVV